VKALHVLKTSVGAAWAFRQIRVLKDLGIEVEVVLPEEAGFAARYREIGVPVHILEMDIARLKAPWRLSVTLARFRRLVVGGEFDLVHSHFVGTTLSCRLALYGSTVPRVFQVPGPLHLEKFATRLLEILSAGSRDYWLASCRATREIYSKAGVASHRLGLAYYGVDVEQITATRPIDLRAELGLSASTCVIGMVAYFYAPKRWFGQSRGLKGHEDLIDAVAVLRRRGQDVVAVFIGGPWAGAGAYRQAVQDYARDRLGGAALFLGHRPDVAAIYPNFDVAVHPSLSENVGGAVESLMAGVPTVASAVGGLPDVVVEGKTGWLAPKANPLALAEAISAALSDPSEAHRRAEAGRALVTRLLDARRNAQDVVKFYRRVLSTS
jgi:glycosyltransferase involved in cell wall biosynthesis